MVKQTLANTRCVVFEITEKCNLSCDYCCFSDKYNYNFERNSRELPLAKAISLLDYILDLQDTPLNRNFKNQLQIGFYGGEPLLNITFIDGIINYL